MNFHNLSRIRARFYAVLAIAALLLLASTTSAFGQRSQDRDNPTQLSSKNLTDDLDGSGDEYFYQFSAGPGRLTVTFEVKASGTNAGATLDLFSANSRPLLANVLAQGVDSGRQRVVKSVQIGKRQNVIMRIKGIKYGDSGGTGVYTVRLDGAVSFDQGGAPAGDGAVAAAAGSNRLTGDLDGTARRQTHTLSITGPGRVTLTFDVKAEGTNAGATFEVLGGGSRPLLSDILVQGVDSGSERVTKTLTFTKPQVVTIRVTGIKYGSSGGRGIYTVQASGPVAQAN